MEKKDLIRLSTLLLGATLVSGKILVTADELKTSVATSRGQVTLVPNEESTKPVNPLDPSKPIVDPEEGEGLTGNKGPLSLDVAPKEFNFGEQAMYITEHNYQAFNKDDLAGGITHQYLQVTDNRDADTYGWVILVKQDRYFTDDSTNNTLVGSTVNVPKGQARNNLLDDSTSIDTTLKTAAVSIDLNEKRIFEASSSLKSGKGTSTSVWNTKYVTLTIPANVAKSGSYSNNILWTLTAEADK
ncbi:WxL domain-containing protein [Enterococcus casseliflavus]|nr:WxL domain-containing protein [Enterococcus casseliflavus]